MNMEKTCLKDIETQLYPSASAQTGVGSYRQEQLFGPAGTAKVKPKLFVRTLIINHGRLHQPPQSCRENMHHPNRIWDADL